MYVIKCFDCNSVKTVDNEDIKCAECGSENTVTLPKCGDNDENCIYE